MKAPPATPAKNSSVDDKKGNLNPSFDILIIDDITHDKLNPL